MAKRGRKKRKVRSELEKSKTPDAPKKEQQEKTEVKEAEEQSEEKKAEASGKAETKKEKGKGKSGAGSYDLSRISENRNLVYAVIAVVAVAIVIWGAMALYSQNAATLVQNQTGTQTCAGLTIQKGDNVEVEYTGELENGEVFDSGKVEFLVGSGQMIKGFDSGVEGMCVGTEKTITVQPADGYGMTDPSRVVTIPITFEINRSVNVTTSQFKEIFLVDAEVGKVYETEGALLPLTVVGIYNETVALEWAGVAGHVIPAGLDLWPIEVVSINETTVAFKRKATDGMTVPTMYGEKEISVTNDNILLDLNHELAGKSLIFKVKVLNATRASALERVCSESSTPKSEKPEVKVFVMSYCPGGTQMEKAVVPVKKLLGDSADIQIMFVNYAMHDKIEIDENTRQYCMQLEQPDKFWDYLDCFLDKADTNECITQAGIDRDKMDECIARADAEFNITGLYEDKSSWLKGSYRDYPYYRVHDAECLKYGVRGSPTVVINDVTVEIGDRTPENFKNHVCCAFNNPPAECSQTLDDSGIPVSGGCGV